jgi:hypothetical protein
LVCKHCASLVGYSKLVYIQPESFDNLKLWSAFVEKCDPSVKIVVATGSEQPPENIDAVQDWCAESYFEYVDAEEKLQETDEEFGDKVGIPLLLETLQANMWDGLVLKSSQAQAEIKGRYSFL